MKTMNQVMTVLEKAGNPLRIQTFANHGALPDLRFGVSVVDGEDREEAQDDQMLSPGGSSRVAAPGKENCEHG
jgi:hypothetical protein